MNLGMSAEARAQAKAEHKIMMRIKFDYRYSNVKPEGSIEFGATLTEEQSDRLFKFVTAMFGGNPDPDTDKQNGD